MNDTQSPARTRDESTAWTLVFVAWLIASASALGALFFSEIMQLPPCSLCWYQRTLMFPLVLILIIAGTVIWTVAYILLIGFLGVRI